MAAATAEAVAAIAEKRLGRMWWVDVGGLFGKSLLGISYFSQIPVFFGKVEFGLSGLREMPWVVVVCWG